MHTLHKMLAEGKSQNQCGRELGFSKQAISKALQRERAIEAGLPTTAPPPKFDPHGLGAFKRLLNTVLTEIKLLNNQIKTAAGDDRSNLNIQRLKYISEARKEFQLALEIDERRFAFEEVLKFKDFVLEEIGKVDDETKDKIIGRLRRGGALKRLLDKG